jgi:hypothetical protein
MDVHRIAPRAENYVTKTRAYCDVTIRENKQTQHLYSCLLTLPDRMSHIRYFTLCFVNAVVSVWKRHVDFAKMLEVIRSQWKPAAAQYGLLQRAFVGSYRYDADITTPFTATFTILLFLYLDARHIIYSQHSPFISYLTHVVS